MDRESLIEKSLGIYARASLTAEGWGPEGGRWEMVESWPSGIVELDRAIIAAGFNFDDGGQQGECGSDLRHRLYTIEFWVFGRTHTQARNVANILKFTIESGDYDGSIPLLQVDHPDQPEIDRLIVLRAHAARQTFQEPEPWQQHAWTTTLVLEDWYNSSQAA